MPTFETPGHAAVRLDIPAGEVTVQTWGEPRVDVEVTPSNCVQCGAITAKGGRLTPPEGGSGPEYSRV